MGHLPSGKASANDNSLAMAQASKASTVDEDAELPPAKTAALDAKSLVPVDINADDLASMEDSLYNSSSYSSPSLSS